MASDPIGADLPVLMGEASRRTAALLDQARRDFNLHIPTPEVRFDLRGKAAGQVRLAQGKIWQIRYNRLLLAREPDAYLIQTVPHEVAHLVAFAIHGQRIRPHGREWQVVMRHFGAEPRRCHDFAVDDLAARRLRRFDYHCACRTHQLTSTRHHRIQAGQRYTCVACQALLLPGPLPHRQPPSGGLA